MGAPKVSIIMPSLNVRPYIEQCMDSVLGQTLKDIEVICVDAGSDDGTRQILDQYAARDKRVKVLDSDRKSYGYQVNLGFDNASGQYLGIVETDDYADEVLFGYRVSFIFTSVAMPAVDRFYNIHINPHSGA